ncbi:hypothetical protein ACFXJO_03455 [Streptomyces lavendulae]|uniref:hypothetical protein n=1 Tax=Streptomyces lavendulae TaxID=1914 RepID=UPI0036CF60AE
MTTAAAPFPIDRELLTAARSRFTRITEPERGQTLLAFFLHFHGDDLFTEPGGLARFNSTGAVPAAAALIRDVLTYIHQHAGGADAVRLTMGALYGLADTDYDEDVDQDGGVIGGLTSTLTEKRLNQIAEDQTEVVHLLADLAAHLGVQTRP